MDYKLLALIATLVATSHIAFNSDLSTGEEAKEWSSYKTKFAKKYEGHEDTYRMACYLKEKKSIEEHNAKKGITYTKGVNQFTDLTNEEFKAIYLRAHSDKKEQKNVYVAPKGQVSDVDWTAAGKVQQVKNQGQCGSCWAFGTMGASESAKAIFKGTLGDFAEQQLVDCNTQNEGCGGGWPRLAYDYLQQNGYCTEDSYPYTAAGGSCQDSSCTKDSFTITGHGSISDCDTLASVLQKQVITVLVDASSWQSYSGGVFSDCGSSIDHGVTLTGMKVGESWSIKNSWAASWGEQGYIRLASGNTCAICSEATYPNV